MLVATLLVAVLVIGALHTVGTVYRIRRLNLDRIAGPAMAHELMSEILSLAYEDPEHPGSALGINPGEVAGNRTTYDDVDDYHGWSSGAVGRDGVARTGYPGWSFMVSVARLNPTTLGTSTTDTGLKRVSILAFSPTGTMLQIVGLRARGGALQQTRPVAASVVSHVAVELRSGNAVRPQYASATLSNHVPDAN